MPVAFIVILSEIKRIFKYTMMKKFLLLFLLFPFLSFSQNNLVRWFNADLTPTYDESHLFASKLTSHGGVSLKNDENWALDQFYISGSWPKPNYNGTSTLDERKYLQFTVSPEVMYKMTLSKFKFNVKTRGLPSRMEVRYSTDNFATYSLLQAEKELTTEYSSFDLDFPNNMVINPGTVFSVRIYVYKTENDILIQHNVVGTISPTLQGTVSLITPVKPIAANDVTGTLKNQATIIDVLSNDDYRFSGALKSINATKPIHGTIVIDDTNKLTYTPAQNYTGYDSFYYTLTNSSGVSNNAKVEIQVLDQGSGVRSLVRWNKDHGFDATNYFPAYIKGDALSAKTENLQYLQYNSGSDTKGSLLILSGLPNPQYADGSLDQNRYLQMMLRTMKDKVTYLSSFKMKFKPQGGAVNITIKYSKNSDFSGAVYTLVNDEKYGDQWNERMWSFPAGSVLLPSENLYIRIYTYKTDNSFLIEYLKDQDSVGPAIIGTIGEYSPEPCQMTTVTWNGKKWNCPPNINKKAIIEGSYNTATNGAFEANNLTVNKGKLTIARQFPVTIENEINVNIPGAVEVQSDANLIQINNAAPANLGNITVLRDIKIGAGRTQYNYLGSPVTFASGQNLKTIYPGITFALYHVESNNFFGNSSGANIPGRGLAVKEPTTTGVAAGTTVVTAQYKGVPQNGEIRFALANSNTETNSSFGYNLLGNPYPSNIDLTKLYDLNGGDHAKGKVSKNIDATFYLWDNEVNNDIALSQQGSAYKGQAYAVYNVLAGSKGTGTSAAGYLNNNIIGAKKPEQVLKVGQGFMTKAIAKNYTLIFNNSIRTEAEVTSSFLGRAQSQDAEDDRFWLKLISPANLTSTMAVVYYEGGSNTFGAEDSESKLGSDDISSLVDDQKVAVNGKSSFTDSDKIALGTQHFQSGIYTIGLEAKEGVFAQGQPIYLKDKQTGNVTKLTEGTYSFEVEAGETADRFEIIYQPETVLVTDTKTKESVVVYRDADQFIIKAPKRLATVFVYDLSGKMIKVLKPNQKEVALDANQLSSGVYVLSITAEDGEVFNRKISK